MKMVNVSEIMEGNFIKIELVSSLEDKRFVILGEGEEKKDSNGNLKLELPVELVQTKKQKLYMMNLYTIEEWVKKYGKDSKVWVGKLGYFKVKTINGRTVVVGYPITKEDTLDIPITNV